MCVRGRLKAGHDGWTVTDRGSIPPLPAFPMLVGVAVPTQGFPGWHQHKDVAGGATHRHDA
jgi:hypothetical protein